MATYAEANRVRRGLKMKFSNYAWYNWCTVIPNSDGYSILVNVKRLDNPIRKIINPVIEGVEIKTENRMRLVIISDTHEVHEQITLPEGDVLIHCGDMVNRGSLLRFGHFAAWMKEQKFEHKLLVYGNHALGFSREPKKSEAAETCRQFGLTLLEESGVEINGIKFWGSPATPYFYDWEFNYHRGEHIAKVWEKIPEDVNVLITHGPPYGILDLVDDTYLDHDLHQGCEELRKKIDSLPNLKVHAFGHLHLQGGNTVVLEGKAFANAAHG